MFDLINDFIVTLQSRPANAHMYIEDLPDIGVYVPIYDVCVYMMYAYI